MTGVVLEALWDTYLRDCLQIESHLRGEPWTELVSQHVTGHVTHSRLVLHDSSTKVGRCTRFKSA